MLVRSVVLSACVGQKFAPSQQECGWLGATVDQRHLACRTGQGTAMLLDPTSRVREAITAVRLIAGHDAALWREASQWWLGILGP